MTYKFTLHEMKGYSVNNPLPQDIKFNIDIESLLDCTEKQLRKKFKSKKGAKRMYALIQEYKKAKENI